jgi:acetyl esterase
MIAGDSAGANLAAAVAVADTGVAVDAVGLLYGIFDYHRALPTLAAIMGGATCDSQWYVPAACFEQLRSDPRLNPERAVHRMPPCWIGVGSADPLLPESTELAAELARAGREYELHVAHGSPHSFLQIPFDPGYDSGWAALLAFLDAHR